MLFVFISERTFEPWDWTNPEVQGIGGSETSHIEMAQRLSRAGHEVESFAPLALDNGTGMARVPGRPIPADDFMDPAGVRWVAVEHFRASVAADLHKRGAVFIIYRAPRFVDELPAGAVAWLICQDVDYTRPGHELNAERAAKFTRIVALCERHGEYLRARLGLELADRVFVSSNGVKAEIIKAIAADPPERNLQRMIYASSPDRGLENLLPIFERVREIVPGAELHVCYGFNNIEKVIEGWAGRSAGAIIAGTRARLLAEMERLGVHHYGRLGQTELLGHWFKSAVWCHPSNFTETSCITCMDAQACGAVPVTTPLWAVAENVRHGVFIDGDVREEGIRARYVRAVAELLLNPQIQGEIRADSMPWAVQHFDWENFAAQWTYWALCDVGGDASRVLSMPSAMAPGLEGVPA